MERPVSIRHTLWQVAPPVPAELRHALSHLHPILLQVLYNRGIVEKGQIQAFLEGRYLGSADPFLLADMDKAVARIQQAIARQETVIVYGDFDADGVTSTVLLTEALRRLGLRRDLVRPYIPDRVDEGYGLNLDAISKLKQEYGADLIISVDCGIRSIAEVAHANAIGVDMIITDHHSLSSRLPPAVAVVNPKRPESRYPERMLAGVGIAYKLAQALHQTLPDAQLELDTLLDLVALGTVADLAPLLGENRKLVQDGLAVLNRAQRPGVAALARVSGVRPGQMTAETIGFSLGPRINAAGRLEHAYLAARLLAANNDMMASDLANRLNVLNKQRQKITADLAARAEAQISPDDPILIARDSEFLSGVVGLVASRLAEKNYRPAIVIEEGAEESRGSCRSIPEFHITEALDEVADLLVRHGGHAQAAGFTILNRHLPDFIARMQALARERLEGQVLNPTLPIDAEISIEDVDWALHEQLAQLEPTGYANQSPTFLSRGVEVVGHRRVGGDGAHLQLQLSAPNGGQSSTYRVLPAIAFRQGDWADQLPQFIDVVYSISLNEWNGRRNLQLVIQDMHPASSYPF